VTLRIGILGAARIAPTALVHPAIELEGVEVSAVAARDPQRAAAFASEHGIPEVAADYAELVRLPGIDAVYNPLPISLHCAWTLEALAAGKHVLCEKPFASNEVEARQMVEAAAAEGRVLMEAFHYLYHPLMQRVLELLPGLGRLEAIEGTFTAPVPRDDIRYQLPLSGGALMDLGCYPLHWLRTLVGEEPEVVSAEARQGPPGVDVEMTARLSFPGGASGRLHCSMDPQAAFEARLHVRGTAGEIRVLNPLAPQLGHQLRVRKGDDESTDKVEGNTTYWHQLEAFAQAVRGARKLETGGEDAIRQMRAIDAVYRRAGLPVRGAASAD